MYFGDDGLERTVRSRVNDEIDGQNYHFLLGRVHIFEYKGIFIN